MATRKRDAESGNSRIRFILLEAEGTGADLQQVADAIAGALKPTNAQIRVIPAASPAALRYAEELEEPESLQGTLFPSASEEAPGVSKPGRPPKAASPRTKPKAPKLVTDLDTNSGDPSLKDHFAIYNPEADTYTFIVLAQWLKDVKGISEVGIDHIYTCLKALGKASPANMPKVFQNATQAENFESKGAGLYSLTHIGEGYLIKKKTGSE